MSQFKKRVKKEISPSLVYPFLEQLEAKGYVAYTLQPVGDKVKKVFALTDEGRELCTCLFKRFAGLVSIAIEPSLAVCAHCGCKVYEGAHHEVIDGKEMAFCCSHCAASYKEVNLRNYWLVCERLEIPLLADAFTCQVEDWISRYYLEPER